MNKIELLKKLNITKILSTSGTTLEFYKTYLYLFKRNFSFTDKEITVVAALLTIREELSKNVTDEALLNKLLFTKEYKDKIVVLAGLSKTKDLDSNYVPKLKAKNILIKREDDSYILNPLLVLKPVIGNTYSLYLIFKVEEDKEIDKKD